MNVHKYPVGSLVFSKIHNTLGYIQSQDENFYGDLIYNIYWFKDEYVSEDVQETLLEVAIKEFKEMYVIPSW